MDNDELKNMGLSDAEIEAMEGDDLDAADDELRGLIGDEHDDAGEDEPGQDDGGEADKPGADAKEPAERVVDEDEPELLEVGDVAAWQSEQEALKAQLEELKREYKEEDSLDFDEYEERRNIIQAQLNKLDTRLEIAADRRSINEQRWAKYDSRIAHEIIALGKTEGVDYTQEGAAKEFDRYLRLIQEEPESAQRSLRQIYQEAHAVFKARHGIVEKPAKADAAKASVKDAAVRQRREAKPSGPPSLALVPAAGPETVGENEFSYLDRLSGIQLERALAKLSPDQQERYLTGAAA